MPYISPIFLYRTHVLLSANAVSKQVSSGLQCCVTGEHSSSARLCVAGKKLPSCPSETQSPTIKCAGLSAIATSHPAKTMRPDTVTHTHSMEQTGFYWSRDTRKRRNPLEERQVTSIPVSQFLWSGKKQGGAHKRHRYLLKMEAYFICLFTITTNGPSRDNANKPLWLSVDSFTTFQKQGVRASLKYLAFMYVKLRP